MPKLTVQPWGGVYSYETGKSLLEIFLENQIFINNACNGIGVCGKCRVKVLSGCLAEPPVAEEKLLKPGDFQAGIRLACFVQPNGDLEIELLYQEGEHNFLTSGYLPEFNFDCDICKKIVEIRKPSLSTQTSFENQIKEQTGAKNIEFSALLGADFTPGIITVVQYEDEVIQIENGDTTAVLYGLAIDIGTTTVVCTLVDLYSGKELANASMINAQKQFGLDVLTRITYELEHPEDGRQKLQKVIVDSINEMIYDISAQAGIDVKDIYEISLSANCTMMHMFLGIDATSIGKAPYAPIFIEAKDVLATSIGLHVAEAARIHCLPAVSAYIGADIVAGAYACHLKKETGNVLFIDIGTNGEIVLASHGRLLSCSCAAGPALEGMNISFGMRASEGAIEDLRITQKGVVLNVIGGKPPVGICGSGILAAIKELLRTGLIGKDGAFIKPDELEKTDYRYPMLQLDGQKREFIIADGPEKLLLTQGDIRQVQLAKGAILSGFLTLLNKAGICMEDLDKVLIAGQFGAHLPADSLTGTGILPHKVEDKLFYVGNSAKTGAYMALMSQKVRREMEELAQQIDYLELGATEGYESLFTDCLFFPDAESGLN